jgi:hypothetical protein
MLRLKWTAEEVELTARDHQELKYTDDEMYCRALRAEAERQKGRTDLQNLPPKQRKEQYDAAEKAAKAVHPGVVGMPVFSMLSYFRYSLYTYVLLYPGQ